MTAKSLWTAGEIAAATGGRASGDWRATGISIDSRTLRAGDLFFAIQGPNFDGHEYVAAAFEAGAAGAVIAQKSEAAVVSHKDGYDAGATLIVVEDTLAALEGLGRAGRARIGSAAIAITGSVGKTGTKESLRAVLGAQAPTHASEKSYNNKWGVPLSLSRTPRDTAYGIFEIGMNKAGEIAGLSPQVRPNVAIITQVSSAHLEFFHSVEAIADAKAEVFIGLEAGGTAIINRDDDHFERLADAAAKRGAGRVIGFGRHGGADARLIDQALHAHCSCVSAEICGQAITYKIGTPGEHWVTNSLAVLAAVSAADADLGLAGLALAGLTAPQGRGNRRKLDMIDGSFELIDESYNGNPASMLAAIEVLALSSVGDRGRRIAVLGDMAELGQEAPRLHGELANTLCDTGIDKVFTVGRLMTYLDRALPADIRCEHTETPEELVDSVCRELRPGDVVMVKGSLSTRMVVLVEALQHLAQPSVSLAATG